MGNPLDQDIAYDKENPQKGCQGCTANQQVQNKGQGILTPGLPFLLPGPLIDIFHTYSSLCKSEKLLLMSRTKIKRTTAVPIKASRCNPLE